MVSFTVHKVVFIDTWCLNVDMCTVNAPNHTWEAVLGKGLFDWFSCPHPAKQRTYVDGVLEPVILQLYIVRLWILVTLMYHQLPLGNFQMQRNVRLQELEQVAKVHDYEQCFSLDRPTTNRQGNIWGAFHLEKKSGNFGENFREFLYGKKLFHFYACVEVRVA